jgi:hypothetical protein
MREDMCESEGPIKSSSVGLNEMKTVVAFTLMLGTLVLATAADAACYSSVRAGKPSILLHPCAGRSYAKVLAIIERPHNGTAVLRADGSIYYSPKPGFTGQDPMTVRVSRVLPIKTFEPQFETVTETYVIWVY